MLLDFGCMVMNCFDLNPLLGCKFVSVSLSSCLLFSKDVEGPGNMLLSSLKMELDEWSLEEVKLEVMIDDQVFGFGLAGSC